MANRRLFPTSQHMRSLLMALLMALLLAQAGAAGAAEWAGYEKLDRAQVLSRLAGATAAAPADFYARNLSGLDLASIDFKGANLGAAVLNGSKLQHANLAGCNLTVPDG